MQNQPEEVKKYRRENYQRIFVNRNIFMDKIQFVGFDMDYTLAEYISPLYEQLIYKHALKRLISIGYPQEIGEKKYNPRFTTRGIIFDKRFGNFLKIDPYGNIMSAIHGLDYLTMADSRNLYRNRFIDIGDTDRFSIFNTLFEFASMFMIGATIRFFEEHPEWVKNDTNTGVERGSIHISYRTIYSDIINVFNYVHNQREMKQETLDNLDLYLKKDERVPLLLKRIRDSGRKTFLVTNSDYWYTNNLLTYMFKDAEDHGPTFTNNWKEYFDIIIVDATKPNFFAEGTSICQVDINTGKKHIGTFKGPMSSNIVYAGGNSEVLSEMLGAQGKDILYVGDHIFGDILKSKKKQGWKTYLVVPELLDEMNMYIKQHKNYKEIEKLEASLSFVYKNMDSSSFNSPEDISRFTESIKNKVVDIEKSYGVLGSLLRCGTRQTFFAGQLTRFADLYSHTCLNILNYPFCYLFRAPAMLMPHEATITIPVKSHSTDSSDSVESPRRKFSDVMIQTKGFTFCAEDDVDCQEHCESALKSKVI